MRFSAAAGAVNNSDSKAASTANVQILSPKVPRIRNDPQQYGARLPAGAAREKWCHASGATYVL
jgi:hypothetical protein